MITTDDIKTLMSIFGLTLMMVGAFYAKWHYIVPGALLWILYGLNITVNKNGSK